MQDRRVAHYDRRRYFRRTSDRPVASTAPYVTVNNNGGDGMTAALAGVAIVGGTILVLALVFLTLYLWDGGSIIVRGERMYDDTIVVPTEVVESIPTPEGDIIVVGGNTSVLLRPDGTKDIRTEEGEPRVITHTRTIRVREWPAPPVPAPTPADTLCACPAHGAGLAPMP